MQAFPAPPLPPKKSFWTSPPAILGIIFATCCIGGLALVIPLGMRKVRETQKGSDFGRAAFLSMASKWDWQSNKPFFNEKMGDDASGKGWFRVFSKSLGPVRSLGPWTSFQSGTDANGESVRLDLRGTGRFERGDATVVLVLREDGEKWTVSGIRLYSPLVQKELDSAVKSGTGK